MTAETYKVEIFIAGDLAQIRATCRKFCLRGACVTVTPTEYIYTGGAESGAIVGLINYPRFESMPVEIKSKAFELAELLLAECCQRSCTVQTPEKAHYIENPEIKVQR